jgi:protein gp37
MGDRTGIRTVDHTQNFWIGCTRRSEGCLNCYAFREWEKYKWTPDFWTVTRAKTTWKNPARWQGAAASKGEVRMVFGDSLGDFFHPDADQWRAEAWAIVRDTPNLIWRFTTKRPELVAGRLPPDWGAGYPNVWLGATVEMRRHLDRLDILRATPASARYLAAEPLLEDLLPGLSDHIQGIDWVAVGGETGDDCRVMDAQWARNVRDLCATRGIAFWFIGHSGVHQRDTLLDGVEHAAYPALLEAYGAGAVRVAKETAATV